MEADVSERKLKLGILGLGRGFMLMLPTFRLHPRVQMIAAADPRPAARAQFERDFQGRSYASVEELAADPDVEIVYVATPHQYHRAHVECLVAAGKHVMVEKPMALTLADCAAMIAAAERAGVHLLVGHSHSFDAPYLKTRALIESGRYGRLRMINALNFTDFLYRPRRPEELDTAQGGGVIFSQAAHQVDIVRLIGGGEVESLRAMTAMLDPARRTEGAYQAQVRFKDGAFAALAYSGYAHFDSDEFCGWIGELGQRRDAVAYGSARAALTAIGDPAAEAALKETRTYGAQSQTTPHTAPSFHNHFGLIIASCDGADLRPTPEGVMIYANDKRELIALPPGNVPRAGVIDEMIEVVIDGAPPLHSGRWGMATLEVCRAILDSAASRQDVVLSHQIATPSLR
jgi:phthalate 4,5-cis-dihydrodiol dehydrogenase